MFWDIAGHFSTVIPFHPLGEPSSAIVFPNFLSSHMQGSAFLCDLCDSAVKNETPTADSRFMWMVGARFPHNGLGLESPATFYCERTFGKRSMSGLPFHYTPGYFRAVPAGIQEVRSV